jgi:hypothetical protein
MFGRKGKPGYVRIQVRTDHGKVDMRIPTPVGATPRQVELLAGQAMDEAFRTYRTKSG